MGLFRRKTQTIDAEHLLREAQGDLGSVASTSAAEEISRDSAAQVSASADFRMTVQDVFTIRGRGTVVTGQVETGSLAVDSVVSLVRNEQAVRRVKIVGVEMFRKRMDCAVAGQNVGLLLDKTGRDDVVAGDVLVA